MKEQPPVERAWSQLRRTEVLVNTALAGLTLYAQGVALGDHTTQRKALRLIRAARSAPYKK